MTQILLDASFLESLKSASSLEEIQSMIATAEKNITLMPETPQQAFIRWQQHFSYLEGNSITRKAACEQYKLPIGTVADWEEKGLVRVIQKAKRRGLHTYINERDVAVMDAMNKEVRKRPSGPIRGWNAQIALQAS